MNDKKSGSILQYINKYPRRVRISLMMIILVVCALLLYFQFGNEDSFRKDICYEIITGVTFTTITIFIISLFNWMIGTKDIQDIQKEQTLSQIIDLMSGNTPTNSSIIDDIYSPDAAIRVMKNAISRLNRRLAEGYSLIAACDTNVIRENFNYDIHIYQKNEIFLMAQNLCYKRYFKPKVDEEKCYLQCGFAFTTEGLNKLIEQNVYFLREEISDPELIDKLKEAACNEDATSAVNAIKLKIQTSTTCSGTEVKIPDQAIAIQPLKEENGKMYGVNILTEVAFVDEDDGMRSYLGRVSFVIPTPNKRRFYCVFADPVIGNTMFRFCIDSKMVSNINDVDYVEILTRTWQDEQHVKRTSEYTMEFHTQDTILPKSAIFAFW